MQLLNNMIIDLQELNHKDEIVIDEDITFDITHKSIKEIKYAHFTGKVVNDITGEIVLSGVLKADVILYDSVDLSDYPLNLELNIEEICDNEQKTLDINEILWHNIVLEVPIRATKCTDSHLKGEGWEMKDEDSVDDEIDPRLAKLQELFKGGE